MAQSLLKLNPNNKDYLKDAMNIKTALIIPFAIFVLGFIIAFFGYPIAISFCCLLTLILSIKSSLNY